MPSIKSSVKAKMGMGFGLIAAVVLLQGLITVAGARYASSTAERLYERDLASLTTIGQVKELTAGMRSRMRTPLAYARPDADRALRADLAEFRQNIDAAWQTYYPSSITDPVVRQVADNVAASYAALKAGTAGFLDQVQAGNPEVARRYFDRELRQPFQDTLDELDGLWNTELASAGNAYGRAEQNTQRIGLASVAVVLVTLLVTLIVVFRLTRMITRPLQEARGFLRRIAGGDLEYRQNSIYHDEFGAVIQAIESMRERFAGVVHEVREHSYLVNAGATRIASGNQELSSRTQEQAANLEETASSMEQMTSTVKQNADNAAQADQLARRVCIQAEEGGEVVGRAVAAMQQIDASSRKIGDIVGLIDDIAFQTNLLALNASVEAARAGEQGRGFAVVASEVRNLASRSAAAAREIKELVGDSAAKVADGSEQVAQSGRTLGEIVESVNRVSDLISEIAAASQEQSSGIEQVNHSVAQMDSMTQCDASLVEQSAAASRSLEEQASELKRQVAFFRLDDDASNRAVEATPATTRPQVPEDTSRQPARTPVAPPDAPANMRADVFPGEDEWATF